MQTVLLVDNGSRRAASTLSLRRIAAALSSRCGMAVHPVSLLHSDRVRASELGGEPAMTLVPFLNNAISDGLRDFTILPLFFGPSRAVSEYIPDQVATLMDRSAELDGGDQHLVVRVADVLWKGPAGEPRLVDILLNNVAQAKLDSQLNAPVVVLVDHGSPVPTVTAVRNAIAAEMRSRLRGESEVIEAAMERRPGAEYAFNGPLLEEALLGLVAQGAPARDVVLAMLFLSPGRHAGPAGDIADICADVLRRAPGLRIIQTPLIGEHPLLVEILYDRLQSVL